MVKPEEAIPTLGWDFKLFAKGSLLSATQIGGGTGAMIAVMLDHEKAHQKTSGWNDMAKLSHQNHWSANQGPETRTRQQG